MRAPILTNHRRDRQQTRRLLADLCTRCRDLTRSSFFQDDIDPINHGQPRMIGFPVLASNGGRH